MPTIRARVALVLVLAVLFVVSGTPIALGQTTPASTTPAPTDPPPTVAPSDGTDSDSLFLFLALIIVAFLLVGVLIGRSRREPASQDSSEAPGFKEYVRDGYSEARWLMDSMSEDLAIWRGNALFENKTAGGDSAGTSMADTWAQLDDRMGKATDSLYRAEASSADQNTAGSVRQAIDALNHARSAIDARAEARYNTRNVDDEDQIGLAQAAERERLASSNLADAQRQLTDALLALSALV